jgi:mannitol-1-phosphate/altronate dehydrogenase
LRQDVIDCYRKEGVNHYDNCKQVTETYYKLVVKQDVGQVQPDWADKSKNEGF